ncbi:MAG: DUF5916 domain-containing protein [bacterium]
MMVGHNRVTGSLLALLLLCGTASLLAQPDSTEDLEHRTLTATRINPHAPAIDGDLSDPVWQSEKLHLATRFIQMEPDEGKPSAESTWVAVIYDDEAVYVAFWNFDSQPDQVKQQLVRRDRWSESDQVTVMLDPYHDHQSGFRFHLNASNVQRDARMFNDADADESWDGVWSSAVMMQPWGWSAEMKIPYHCLRFAAAEEQTWGFNLARYISRLQENSWWNFSPSTEGGYVSQFGDLNGLRGITPARHLEVLPYSVTKLETEAKHAGNPDGRDFLADLGFDLKYGLSSNMTLDATINPDFGQVELDSPELNLSAFETMFGERRPFFLEGSDLFSTPFALFYSRRIGRSPSIWPDNVDYYENRPTATTILGATKITGKVGNGTAIGVLTAATKREEADFVDVSGLKQTGVVEPEASYNVFRVKQDLVNASSIGFLGTVAAQDGYHSAMTGGVDWTLNSANSVWGASGQIVGSSTSFDKTGFGMTANMGKRAGKNWRGSVGWTIKDPHLDINDLGYTSRNDFRQTSGWVQYRTAEQHGLFRRTYHNFNGYIAFNYNGDNIVRGWNYNNWFDLTNGWEFGGGIDFSYDKYDDYETRGNGLWKQPFSWSWWWSIESDQRKMVSLTLNPGSGKNRDGTWWAHYTGVSVRPRTNMEFEAGVNVLRYFNNTRWVDSLVDPGSGQEVPIFADLDQDMITGRLTASITLRTNLSWQISGSLLMSGLDYRDYRRYLGGDDYGELDDIALDGEYDFNYVAVNSTMILRWEYLPGSTLYFVWTRAQQDSGDYNNLDVSRDLETAFSSDAENIWLIKASYWWNI